jgi:formylglycine-generating enzyme required for sulfatase activity
LTHKKIAKPRRIFISSTSEDLEEYRIAARDAVLSAGCQPVMMEYFTPQGKRKPLEACLREVDYCDAVIAIVAHRYGWVPKDQPDGDGKSITWLECERAVAARIEVLGFVVSEKCAWPETGKEAYRAMQAIERGAWTPELVAEVSRNVKRLQDFKAWLSGLGFRGEFAKPDDLKMPIALALTAGREGMAADTSKYFAWLREYTGWIDIRGLQVGSGKVHRFPIRDLYTPLTAAGGAPMEALAQKAVPRDRVALEEALTRKRLVITGDPGSGKTTFLRRIAQECCSPSGDLKLPAGTFPLFLRIAELEEHIATCIERKHDGAPATAEDPEWLLHFLESRKWDLDADYFDRSLHEERTMVLLDGLDEAPDRVVRERIARLFENATQRYPECRFVVTTRPGAYQDRATLAGFDQVKIDDLSDDAVERFLGHWSKALHPSYTIVAAAHQGELLSAVRGRPSIRRMARNPVMLTALAVLHWNDKRLPEQRAELYESILVWLARAREKAGRERAETCLRLLGQLALGMQTERRGRVRQIGRRRAAELIAPELRDTREEDRLSRAGQFLEQEEVDSGIVVSRSAKVEFWHLTFQEHLAARALAGLPDSAQQDLLLRQGAIYEPEWREVVLLYAGLLGSKQGPEKVDALFAAVLDAQGTDLKDRARCAGLLGAIQADLKPSGYTPPDARYKDLMEAVLAVFDPETSAGIPLKVRVEAAEALGQAGDPRLRENNWVRIPAGTFVMGKGDEAHDVELDAYEIGRYPVTVEEYGRYVEEGGREPRDWEKQLEYPNRPVVNVSWGNARRYCGWAGVRLPTEAEWERAARGQVGRGYPWGAEEPDEDRANYGEAGIGAATPVGLFAKGATPDGIYDLAGNVWEWVSDWHGRYPKVKQRNPTGPAKGIHRVLRGGAWDWDSKHLRTASRFGLGPEYRDNYVGFRCARDVRLP